MHARTHRRTDGQSALPGPSLPANTGRQLEILVGRHIIYLNIFILGVPITRGILTWCLDIEYK